MLLSMVLIHVAREDKIHLSNTPLIVVYRVIIMVMMVRKDNKRELF